MYLEFQIANLESVYCTSITTELKIPLFIQNSTSVGERVFGFWRKLRLNWPKLSAVWSIKLVFSEMVILFYQSSYSLWPEKALINQIYIIYCLSGTSQCYYHLQILSFVQKCFFPLQLKKCFLSQNLRLITSSNLSQNLILTFIAQIKYYRIIFIIIFFLQ